MALEWDPVTFINLVLCIIIVILAFLCYRKSQEKLPLFIGAAFGLFGISHAATLAGFKVPLTIPLIIIRTLAYILVIIALWLYPEDSLILREIRQGWVDYFKSETNEQDEKKSGRGFITVRDEGKENSHPFLLFALAAVSLFRPFSGEHRHGFCLWERCW